ncbi:SPFH domain-containing protein [Trichlorobacter ammonificans]|uniref:Band 7 protein n=1 Tax=Trichlorobacter ammonificans TaxID=2916410 RepID=A0ABM9D6Q1_9BACT|nr:SPFH domain-containing protein [Trichlorobacter ammonificans]CAH2030870.1 Band 7 protein [Trichlorobacter ammonificans]
MALWDKLKGELIDIIQWLDDTNDTLVFRFPRYNNEIKYNAKLVVREGQTAVFINEGQVADIFLPGTYTLTTQNLPILATLKGWKYGFESPFKADVYFCSTRQFTNLKWGTPGPCTMRDPEFGVVRVTAFGLYAIRIKDPALFIREVAGTDGNFTTEEIQDNLKGKIGLRIKEVMPELKLPVIDLESKVYTLGEMLKERIAPAFEGLGINLTEIQVQDVGLPEEVERAIDKAGAMKAIGNLQAYTQYETAGSINDAANNPGGLAAAGVGIGMGFGMGGQMAGAMGGTFATQAQPTAPPAGGGAPGAVPPPLPPQTQVYLALNGQQAGPFDMTGLQQMVRSGQVTRDTLAWKQGMADWAAAGTVAELISLFEAVPPPLPK